MHSDSIMKLQQKVACGPDLKNYVTLDYLDLRQCYYFRYMKLYIFQKNLSHRPMGFDHLVITFLDHSTYCFNICGNELFFNCKSSKFILFVWLKNLINFPNLL